MPARDRIQCIREGRRRQLIFRQAAMDLLWFLHVAIDGRFEDADVGEIAVALSVVQAVADDEAVGDAEAEVIDGNFFDAWALFVEQGAEAEAERSALPKQVHQVM